MTINLMICGMAKGKLSAATETYYANPSNKFWRILHEIGLTPYQLKPSEYSKLAEYGVLLCDLNTEHSGMDKDIPKSTLVQIERISNLIHEHKPRAFAFNGKAPAQDFWGNKKVEYGKQPKPLHGATIFILPSTSGAANGYWNINHWEEMATFLKS